MFATGDPLSLFISCVFIAYGYLTTMTTSVPAL